MQKHEETRPSIPPALPLCENLHRVVSAILGDSLGREDLNGLIRLCHSLAVVALRRKITAATLHTKFHESSYSDLAYDAIADLFRRDDRGSLLQLKTYFQGIDHRYTSDQELLVYLRRLVFSRVNQSVYRIYAEADPSLGKVLRNVKLALQAMHNFTLTERCGESSIYPDLCPTLEQLPQMNIQELECVLRQVASTNDPVPAIMAQLSLYLRTQKEHSRILPVMSVALAVRALYTSPLVQEAPSVATVVTDGEDTSVTVRRASEQVKKLTRAKYLDKKRLNPDWFDLYFDIITKNIAERLDGTNVHGSSFYDGLKGYLPLLTREEYIRVHRSTIEYFARLTRKQVGKLLRK